jgi:hypothetical protein
MDENNNENKKTNRQVMLELQLELCMVKTKLDSIEDIVNEMRSILTRSEAVVEMVVDESDGNWNWFSFGGK